MCGPWLGAHSIVAHRDAHIVALKLLSNVLDGASQGRVLALLHI
jgi:hypothetical protein